jgi:3'(2'), 5'-bisphosphate nucleotidase
MPRKKLLLKLLPIALDAGDAILRVYNSDFAHELKEDRSVLTKADLDSQNVIIRGLLDLGEPALPVLSEETEAPDFDTRSSWSNYWLVDPLDGTREFVNRNGEFTVNIALIDSGVPVLGVVYAPSLGRLYFGALGEGSWFIDSPESLVSLRSGADAYELGLVCEARVEASPYVLVGSRSHRSDKFLSYVEEVAKQRGEVETIGVGSSLKFCMLAQGLAHEYPRFGPTMEWDTAAGDAIVRSIGGQVLDFSTGEPLRYNKRDLRNPSFVCHF